MLKLVCEQALRHCSAWRDSSWRRAVNKVGAETDLVGHVMSSTLFSVLLVVKTWLREGLPGLALRASSLALLSCAMAALIMHRSWGRRVYVSHRELLMLVCALHMQWVVRLTALEGGVNTIDHHSGSALILLLLMLGHTTALYGALVALYARLVRPASGLLLACMALNSVYHRERMCERVLESPGVEVPLADLHSLLSLIRAPGPPAISRVLSTQEAGPKLQCLAVYTWLSVVAGALLPFFLLCWLEERICTQQRQAGLRRVRQQQAEPQHWQQAQHAAEITPPPLACRPSRILQFYLLSSAVWVVVCSTAA